MIVEKWLNQITKFWIQRKQLQIQESAVRKQKVV